MSDIWNSIINFFLGDEDGADKTPVKQEPPETPGMAKFRRLMKQSDEVIKMHYPGCSWRFACEDQASVLSDDTVAKQVIIHTMTGATEYRVLIFETKYVETDSGHRTERQVSMQTTSTEMERKALRELNARKAAEGRTLWMEDHPGEPVPVAKDTKAEDPEEEEESEEKPFSPQRWFKENGPMLELLKRNNASGRYTVPKNFCPADAEDMTALVKAFETKGLKVQITSMGLEIA